MPTLRKIFSFGVGALGLGVGSAAVYYATSRRLQPPSQHSTSTVLKTSASALTSAIVDSVLKVKFLEFRNYKACHQNDRQFDKRFVS